LSTLKSKETSWLKYVWFVGDRRVILTDDVLEILDVFELLEVLEALEVLDVSLLIGGVLDGLDVSFPLDGAYCSFAALNAVFTGKRLGGELGT
jgi:hypothetical protein